MTVAKLATAHVLPERRHAGRPKKILDLRKLDKVRVAVPESAERAIESLLIFDVRCLDVATRQEILRILPQLVHIRRAWRAEYMECGCLACPKPDPTVAIAARLRRRGSTWAEIYEITAVKATNRAERKRFENAVRWKLGHLDAPTRNLSPRYGAGGFCDRCSGRIYQRMLKRYRKLMAGRDLPAELATFTEALTLKFSLAQQLLNGDDENFAIRGDLRRRNT